MIVPVSFFFGSAAIYCFSSYVLGTFSRTVGIVLLSVFAIYMLTTVLRMKKSAASIETVQLEERVGALTSEAELEAQSGEDHTVESKETGSKDSLLKDILLLVVGAVLIAIGASLLNENAQTIARECGVSEKVIGLTIVALGTSLPELVTAITSLAKGHSSLSLGNIIGANLFNLVLVSGTAISINPFTIPADKTIAGMNASLVVDVPLMWFVMLMLSVPALLKGKLYRFQGVALLAIYFAYVLFQFFL
jgi:cation:H+ antiporter